MIPNSSNPHPICSADTHALGNQKQREIPAQKLTEKMARKHQTELHSANSTTAMAKFTQTSEPSTNLQPLMRGAR